MTVVRRCEEDEERVPEIKLYRREKGVIMMIITCCSVIRTEGTQIKDRLKAGHKRGWMMLQAALGLLGRVQDILYKSVPVRQLAQLRTECENSTAVIVPCSTILPKAKLILDANDLNVITYHAINNECRMCAKLHEREWKNCDLYKVMMKVWPPADKPTCEHCPYMDIEWYSGPDTAEEANLI